MNFKRIIKKSTSIILALAIMIGVLTHFSMDVEAANGTWNGGTYIVMDFGSALIRAKVQRILRQISQRLLQLYI